MDLAKKLIKHFIEVKKYMPEVTRKEIIDYVTYSEKRDNLRPKIMAEKDKRRVHIGKYLTFLFENHETIWYQIQEMMRAEQMVKEADIQYEIETYNELVTANGSIGCSLLIEIDDINIRQQKLSQWLKLPEKIFLTLESGEKVPAIYDKRQIGSDRLSSVQYLRFDVKGKTPVSIDIDMPEFAEDLPTSTKFSDEQLEALSEDLSS